MKKIKVAIVGMGRLGKSYVEKLFDEVKQAEVVSLCSIVPEERKYGEEYLPEADIYEHYSDMLEKTEAEAVFLITSTDQHADQIIAALEAGKHVFCEKPLSLSVADCERVIQVAKKYPHLIMMVGFVRRFDRHYQFAKKKVQEGAIGKIFRIDSQTADIEEFVPFQLEFGKTAGSMFLDYNVHDVDLVHWFTESKFDSIHSMGSSIAYPEFDALGSADNALSVGQMKNQVMVTITASRTAAHGHWTYTVIHGTKGVLKIGEVPMSANVQILDQQGVRSECYRTFYDRFEEAFTEQMKCFLRCVSDGTPSPISPEDALENTRVGIAMTESFAQKKLVRL